MGDVGAWVGKREASGKEGMGCEGRGGGGGGEPKPRRGAPERGGAYLNGGIKPRIKQCLTHTTHDTHTPPPTRALRAYGLSARWAPGALRPPPTLTRGTRTLAWRRGGGEPFRAVPPAVWPRGNDRGALGRGRVSAARERGEASDARNGRNWRGSVAVSGLGPRRAPSGGPRGAGGGLAAKHGMGGRRRGARSRCSGDGGSRVSNARLLRRRSSATVAAARSLRAFPFPTPREQGRGSGGQASLQRQHWACGLAASEPRPPGRASSVKVLRQRSRCH